jgi:hypothetical protein
MAVPNDAWGHPLCSSAHKAESDATAHASSRLSKWARALDSSRRVTNGPIQ